MKIMLCNDTGIKAHSGCLAVSDAHARLIGRAGHSVSSRYFVNALAEARRSTLGETTRRLRAMPNVMADIEAADAVIVNGEGTIHHGQGLEYIALLSIAKELGKAALLINAVFQAYPGDAAILNNLDDFIVREQRSLDYAKSLGIRCRFLPDAIIEAKFEAKPHRDFDGGVIVTDWVKTRASEVGAISGQILNDFPMSPTWLQPLHAGENRQCWQRFVASFATANTVITSRHHAIYLSLLAGTPFIAFRSSTWKIEGLLESLQLSVPLCSSFDDVLAGLAWARENTPAFLEARDKLLAFLPLGSMSSLGVGGESREEEEVAGLKNDIESQVSALKADALSNAKKRMNEQAQIIHILEMNQNWSGSAASFLTWRNLSKARKRISRLMK